MRNGTVTFSSGYLYKENMIRKPSERGAISPMVAGIVLQDQICQIYCLTEIVIKIIISIAFNAYKPGVLFMGHKQTVNIAPDVTRL